MIWNAIADNSWVIIILIMVWVIGVIVGGKFAKTKVIYLKNPFKGRSSVIRDETLSGSEAMKFKREYQINLIMADDKNIDYESLSDFTFYVDDLAESGKLKNLKLLNANIKIESEDSESRQKEKMSKVEVGEMDDNSEAEVILNLEDIDYFLPNEYIQQ